MRSFFTKEDFLAVFPSAVRIIPFLFPFYKGFTLTFSFFRSFFIDFFRPNRTFLSSERKRRPKPSFRFFRDLKRDNTKEGRSRRSASPRPRRPVGAKTRACGPFAPRDSRQKSYISLSSRPAETARKAFERRRRAYRRSPRSPPRSEAPLRTGPPRGRSAFFLIFFPIFHFYPFFFKINRIMFLFFVGFRKNRY